MANYSLVANTTFQPFTYQELVAPVAHQQQALENLAEQYDKLSAQADVLEAMGANDRDKNSGTYARYKAYSDKLRQEADNLYRFGLNTESRQRLTDLRRMYNTEIVPIQNAWNKRDEEAKLQTKAEMEAAARGIDLRFSRRAADTDLQSYIDNPNQTFRAITGQQITTEIANQFKGLASQIQQDRNGNYWIGKKQLSPIEYAIITQKGMDYNQFADFINNPTDPNYSTIRGIIENNLAAHGIQDFDPKTQADMFRYGAMGVSAGVGERGMQFHTDPYASKMLDAEVAIAKERAKRDGSGAGGDTMTESLYELPMGEGKSATVRGLNYEKGTWNQTTKRQPVKEITGYKDGKPVFDSKTISLGELLNRKDSSKNDIEVASFWSEVPGHEGLILTTSEDGKAHRYFISAGSLAAESNVAQARKHFETARKAAAAGNKEKYKEAIEAAYRTLHAGLTIENTADKQQLNRDRSVEKTFE